jgi:hypothetical protein
MSYEVNPALLRDIACAGIFKANAKKMKRIRGRGYAVISRFGASDPPFIENATNPCG